LQHKTTLVLNFDFPEAAARHYDGTIRALETETGWTANIRMTTNQQALMSLVRDLLPAGAKLDKTPSLYMDRKTVAAEVSGVSDADAETVREAYMDRTNYTLDLVVRTANGGNGATPTAVTPDADDSGPLEINAAYGLIRSELEPLGLQKAGLKNGEIVLTFVSPQVGARYADEMAALAAKTGYALRLHENPMQNVILDEARALLRSAGWTVSKGPGIHTDRGEVSVKLVDPVSAADATRLSDQLETATGYRLVVR
jgi:hypothetical protein